MGPYIIEDERITTLVFRRRPFSNAIKALGARIVDITHVLFYPRVARMDYIMPMTAGFLSEHPNVARIGNSDYIYTADTTPHATCARFLHPRCVVD